jgi:hypothetical protein
MGDDCIEKGEVMTAECGYCKKAYHTECAKLKLPEVGSDHCGFCDKVSHV